ncbi:MAG TPA: VWA domain-containing protein [Thermoanaerobaculia bacterium]|nr:VWA domain-containing protein [Thermoanaerobaculia bacterium]
MSARTVLVLAAAIALGGCDARIGEPSALWALWLLPALVVFYAWSFRRRSARLRRFASPEMVDRLTGGPRRRAAGVKAALVVLAMATMLLTLARVQVGHTWEEVERRGVDIVVALDVSDSMLAEDVGRSLHRLERAKRELFDLLRRLEGDRIGIVAFAGTAFVQCPLTLDYGAAELFLGALDQESIPVQGTDLEQALETSLRAFRGGAAGSRAILLITDGEDHSGRALAVAERLRAEGVRVFAIGIGSEGGAPIPARGGGFRRDRRGDIILSRLDERTLQQIALTTGGRYVRSVSGDLDLEEIYAQGIKATLDEREIQAHRRQRFYDRFQWLLAVALGALMVESLVPERGGARRARRAGAPGAGRGAPVGAVSRRGGGLASSPSRAASSAALALLLAGAAPPPARYPTPEEAYAAGDFAQALAGFLDLQVERPSDAAVTMNVGSAHYRLDDLESAVRSFEAAGAAGDDSLRAEAWYDLGNVAYRQGLLEQAIELYHRSLDLDPSDEDAKWNLELVHAELERRQQEQQEGQQSAAGGSQGEDQSESGGEGDDEGASTAADGAEDPGDGAPDRPADGAESGDHDRAEGAQANGAPAPHPGAAEGALTAAEARRLLDSLEEGRPRRRVPPDARQAQEKDW